MSQYHCNICVFLIYIVLFFFSFLCLFFSVVCLFVCLFVCVCVYMLVARSCLQLCISFWWMQGIHANVFNNVRANREHLDHIPLIRKGRKKRKRSNSNASMTSVLFIFSLKRASYMVYVLVLWLTSYLCVLVFVCMCCFLCVSFVCIQTLYKSLWYETRNEEWKGNILNEKKMRKMYNGMKNQRTIVWQTGKQKEMC